MTKLKAPVTSNDHIRGNVNAPLTLLEYSDFECPYCKKADPIVKSVQRQFGDHLRFVFRHFPLVQLHPHAELAAETAEFAGAQDHFWEAHDLLFSNQDRLRTLGNVLLFELITAIGLSAAELQLALEKRIYYHKVQHDLLSVLQSGVKGTPTFFINGDKHEGSYEYEDLVFALEKAASKRTNISTH